MKAILLPCKVAERRVPRRRRSGPCRTVRIMIGCCRADGVRQREVRGDLSGRDRLDEMRRRAGRRVYESNVAVVSEMVAGTAEGARGVTKSRSKYGKARGEQTSEINLRKGCVYLRQSGVPRCLDWENTKEPKKERWIGWDRKRYKPERACMEGVEGVMKMIWGAGGRGRAHGPVWVLWVEGR